ncbi:MAG TPA: ABC transporter substrate-binding protein [Terrimesophilobacter sp.]|jgi:ABC-type branched-chain amino acid transport systems, periplasmic component|uniref:ABC transporter substrate-binding protein n=1 Tax=Terrimesophilobacter sp. TaxID=2906435 RepID=UPI002F927C48
MSVFAKAKASRSNNVKSILSGLAMIGVGALVLSGCAPTTPEKPAGPTKNLTLNIGTLLPQTGALAFLGPPEEAGVALAVKDINDAKMGITVDVTYGDSGDPDNKAYATTVPTLLAKKVSAIIGAAASGVSKLVIDQVTGSGTILFSPANTSPDFTTWKDDGLYWRTAPSDLLQGEVLGNLIAEDGAATLGIIALNDAYGTGLQKVTDKTFTDAGGKVVATEFFNTGDTNFTAQITSVMAQKPDAIALISFDEAKTIIPALKDAGFDTSKLYLVDGNTTQYGTEGKDALPAGVMTGAKGTQPGPVLPDDFVQRLKDAYAAANNGKDMGDALNYAAESYDAVVLLALAALAANSTDGKAIAAKLQEVSGGSGNGEKATDFKSAATIINAGDVVDYDGYSGGIKFDDVGDPTEATIGIFQYDATNHHTRINK